jgi:hypothetical protein
MRKLAIYSIAFWRFLAIPKRVQVASGVLLGLLAIIALAPAPYESVFAQSVSPFTAPVYTSTPPSTGPTGTIYYATGTQNLFYYNGANNVPVVNGPLGSTTTSGALASWSNANYGLASGGISYANSGPAAAYVIQANSSGVIANGWFPQAIPSTCTAGGSFSAGTLVKFNGSGNCISTGTSDTTNQVYIALNTVTSGNTVYLAVSGIAPCTVTGSVTALHFAVPSTTAGTCSDGGSSQPSGYTVIGQFTASGSSGNVNVALPANYLASAGTGSGVTSVSLAVGPSSGASQLFTISGSPVTSTGTLTATLVNNISAGNVFAGPCTGAATTPAWRALCYADLTAAFSQNSVTQSGSSATFNLALGNGQTITLSGNVSTVTVSNPTTGGVYQFLICQNSTGGYTFTWPAAFHGPMAVGATPSDCSAQSFYYNGSIYYATGPGVINQ